MLATDAGELNFITTKEYIRLKVESVKKKGIL